MAKKAKKTHKVPKVVKARRRQSKPPKTRTSTRRGVRKQARPLLEEPESASGLDLGPIQLPSATEAVKVLGELAVLNDKTLEAHARYLEAAGRAKTLKGIWEEYAEKLQKLLRAATHKAPMPLFDGPEEAAAVERMVAGEPIPAAAAPQTAALADAAGAGGL